MQMELHSFFTPNELNPSGLSNTSTSSTMTPAFEFLAISLARTLRPAKELSNLSGDIGVSKGVELLGLSWVYSSDLPFVAITL